MGKCKLISLFLSKRENLRKKTYHNSIWKSKWDFFFKILIFIKYVSISNNKTSKWFVKYINKSIDRGHVDINMLFSSIKYFDCVLTYEPGLRVRKWRKQLECKKECHINQISHKDCRKKKAAGINLTNTE